MIKFGANILSQTVQRNLGRATLDLSITSERLASGQRINKASDDAAGLAISASLNVNARIFTQGVRNLNDGLSAVNIAEGAMGELGGIIVRIEELATQSINETYSDTQRQALQKEATALTAEWNRIVESTSFNGQSLLTGLNTRTVLQGGGGAGVDSTLAVQIGAEQYSNGIEGLAGGTTRVSTDSVGAEANGTSYFAAISADAKRIAFMSTASNLVTGDANAVSDIFVRDISTGAVVRANTSSSGVEANGSPGIASISAEGRYVAFHSTATNLVLNDSNGQGDVFLKDLNTGTTTIVSTNSAGQQGVYASFNPVMSADARYIAFSSAATLVAGDTNGFRDIFVKDTATGETVIASRSTNGTQGNANSGGMFVPISMSSDGRYVAFYSTASNLVSGDTNSTSDVFVRDIFKGTTTRVSTDSAGSQIGAGAFYSVLSGDGRYVAFFSNASDLVAGDTNGTTDLFLKDLTTGNVTLVSSDEAGTVGNGSSTGGSWGVSLSADGRFVTFNSAASNLVAGDTNGVVDSFVKDTLTGNIRRLSVSSSGTQGNASAQSGTSISADGRFAAFAANATNLVAGDANAARDIFLRDLTKTGVQTLAGIVVSDKTSAKMTLDLAQKYRAELLDYRSKLGATISRISTFVNTLQSSTINYKAASSRITDADIAEEAAKSIASGIRQQVAASLLGQANQAPQIALRLLQNA